MTGVIEKLTVAQVFKALQAIKSVSSPEGQRQHRTLNCTPAVSRAFATCFRSTMRGYFNQKEEP